MDTFHFRTLATNAPRFCFPLPTNVFRLLWEKPSVHIQTACTNAPNSAMYDNMSVTSRGKNVYLISLVHFQELEMLILLFLMRDQAKR
jgi:hypothetical protein